MNMARQPHYCRAPAAAKSNENRTVFKTFSGHIDILLQTEGYIYIIEIKTDSRKIFKIGINFDKESRRIGEWKVMG